MLFHNGLNYDYHFIIKELQKGFHGEFDSVEENSIKHKIFSVAIIKEVKRIDKNG